MEGETEVMMLIQGCSFPREVVAVDVGLAFIDGIIAVVAFSQLTRIHSRTSQLGWTRQKVFHLLIGSSNIGYFVCFVASIFAACKGWLCWSYSCGFILMAFPKILFFAAFLLLLSFWIDLCHQADDEDYEEEDFSFNEALLEMSSSDPNSVHAESHRMCLPFRSIHVGSRQKIVILVTVLLLILMMTFAALIWIGMGNNSIDSSLLAKVQLLETFIATMASAVNWFRIGFMLLFSNKTIYVDGFAAAMLVLGGALTCYGILLCSKIRRVRSERAVSEMWKVGQLALYQVLMAPYFSLQKLSAINTWWMLVAPPPMFGLLVAGLAVLCVLCFTSSSFVAILTNIPVLYHGQKLDKNGLYTSLILILYYFIGSSVPSASVLWVMRELPPNLAATVHEGSTTITFVHDNSAEVHNLQQWATVTSLQNQMIV